MAMSYILFALLSATYGVPPDSTLYACPPVGYQTQEDSGWSIAPVNTQAKPPSISLEAALIFQPYRGQPNPIMENSPDSSVAEWDLDPRAKHYIGCKYSGLDALLLINISKHRRCASDSLGSFRCW